MRPSWSQRALALVSVFVLTATFPAAATEPDTDGWGEIQGIAVGDYWNYEARGDAEGTITNEVTGTASKKNHFGKTYDTLVIHSVGDLVTQQRREEGETGTSASVPVEMDTDTRKWVRATDYAAVQIEGTTKIQGGKESEQTIAYDPPLVDIIYPFGLDYSWYWQGDRYIKKGGEPETEATYRLTADSITKEEVSVPAGTFDAFRIEYRDSDGSRLTRWYAEEACELVKEELRDKDGEVRARLLLTEYTCAHIEKDNPVYDPDHVTLTAGTPPPPGSGVESPGGIPGPDDPEVAAADAPTLWISLFIVVAVAALLYVVGRKKLQ